MIDINKIDQKLFSSLYGIPKEGNYKAIWKEIKEDKEILREAVKIEKDKWEDKDIVKGLTICSCMLKDYNNIDKIAYKELIKNIYSNVDISRIVVGEPTNTGPSFLLLSLLNHDLKLNDDQKAFAVNEAMNKPGTVTYNEKEKIYLDKIKDHMRITNTNLIKDVFGVMTNQFHGKGSFDIRYYILRNPNWTKEEKKKLVYDFWAKDESYEETLNDWEWEIINDTYIPAQDSEVYLDISELYNYTYDEILYYFKNKEKAHEIWEEIEFCRLIKKLRKTKDQQVFFTSKTEEINEIIEQGRLMGIIDVNRISNGRHTFKELYNHITMLFCALCNSFPESSWKLQQTNIGENSSLKPNSFIAGIDTKEGPVIYNFDMRYWDLFEIPEVLQLPSYDDCSDKESLIRILTIKKDNEATKK